MRRRTLLLAAITTGCASAPNPPPARPTRPPPPPATVIRVHDQVRCQVAMDGDDAPPTVTVDAVGDDGRLVQNTVAPVPVAGLTEPAAADAIAKAYADQHMTAHVTVADLGPPTAVPQTTVP